MNPLASSKCARRLLMALAAISGIFLTAGCGSSSSPPPINPVGFSKSSLTGTYVFSSQGLDASGYPVALAGTLVSNGSGITGGTIDVIDPGFTSIPATAAQTITGGSYSVNSDGRGNASLSSSYGNYVLDFVLISTSHGLVTEFDGYGGGSGTIDLQTAVTSLSQLAGPYAFSLAGSDGSANLDPFVAAGAFNLNSSGTITAGVEDFNDNGFSYTQLSISAATAALGAGTGPGSLVLSTASFPGLTFDFYPIDATHWKFIETDYAEFLAGDVFTQTGASIPQGAMAFTMAGGTSTTGPIANGGLMTSDGTGNFSAGLEDVNNDGSVTPAQLPFSALLDSALSGPVGGRVVTNLTGFDPATQWVIYPSGGGLLMLEIDAANLTSGAAYAQSPGAALAASQNYGFNLSAFNTGGPFEENDIAQFLTTSTGFGGVVDINDNYANGAPTLSSLALSANYTLDSPATGRGEATTTAAGSAYISFDFYAVTNNQFLVLETDSTQIGAGTFEQQSTPGAGAAAHRAVSMVRPTVRPMARPHAALRRR